MNAPRYTCGQLGVCQHRTPACQASCRPQSAEQADASPTPLEWWVGPALLGFVMLLVLCFVGAAVVASTALHTVDDDLRQALAWAWEQLARLYWAVMHVSG